MHHQENQHQLMVIIMTFHEEKPPAAANNDDNVVRGHGRDHQQTGLFHANSSRMYILLPDGYIFAVHKFLSKICQSENCLQLHLALKEH